MTAKTEKSSNKKQAPEPTEFTGHIEDIASKTPKPPEGIVSFRTLASILGISRETCAAYAVHLSESDPNFGEMETYFFTHARGTGLSTAQQELLRAYKESKIPPAPDEGVTSASSVADEAGVTYHTLARHLNDLVATREDFGGVGTFAFGNNTPGLGLTDAQRSAVLQELSGLTTTVRAPDGILSAKTASAWAGMNYRTFIKIANKLTAADPNFGPINNYLFNKVRGKGYDERQINLVTEEYKRRRAKLGQKAIESSDS